MKLSILRVMFSAMLSLCCAAHTVFAAPQAELWDRWQASDPAGIEAVDHGPWSWLLSKYVIDNHPSGVNRMAYSEVTPADNALPSLPYGGIQGMLRAVRELLGAGAAESRLVIGPREDL